MLRISSLKPIIVSLPSAMVASLCCILPLAVVLLGAGILANMEEVKEKTPKIGKKDLTPYLGPEFIL